jgi:hypothetical protein
MKTTLKFIAQFFLLGCLCLAFSSCKRLDGETLVEGQVVDRHTGEAIPNARLVMFSRISRSSGGAYNTIEFERLTDSKGNFSFKFESDGSKSYVLRAFKDPGYYTIWDEAAHLDEGRNNKRLKLKMQAPAWVRVKLVNVPPKDIVARLHLRGFSDLINGQDYVTFYSFNRDTTFVRMIPGNVERLFVFSIRDIAGNTIETNPSAYFPALDTTDLIIHY